MSGARQHKIPQSVLVVIHTSGLDVLLIERADHPGFWQSVTGAKESLDESWFETAAREVAEETGIRLTAIPSGDGDARPSLAVERGGAPAVPWADLRDWGLVNEYEIYPHWRHRYAPGVTRNTEHVFGLRVPRDIAITLAPREHLRHQWLPWREAADRCSSASNAEAILHLPRFA